MVLMDVLLADSGLAFWLKHKRRAEQSSQKPPHFVTVPVYDAGHVSEA